MDTLYHDNFFFFMKSTLKRNIQLFLDYQNCILHNQFQDKKKRTTFLYLTHQYTVILYLPYKLKMEEQYSCIQLDIEVGLLYV